MNMRGKKNVNRWKKAQRSELNYYDDYFKKTGSVERKQSTITRQFEQWGFNNFENKSVLEVGCGLYDVIHNLPNETFKVGVDPLLDKLRNNLPSNIYYVRSVGENLPFQSDKFDVVVCNNVLDHVINPHEVLFEIRRVLKTSGTFLLCVNTHVNFIKILTSILWQLDSSHPHHFTSKEVEKLFAQHNFGIVKIKVTRVLRDPLYRNWWMAQLVSGFNPWKVLASLFFTQILYATAKKVRN